MTTSVLLVDDHAIIRKGLRLLLEEEADMRVVGEAGDGRAAVAGVRDHAPDVVIMDISMPDVNGVEAARHITATFPGIKIIALSIHSGKQFVKDMLGAGAVGYVLKESAPEEIVEGIHAVMRGEIYLSAAVTETVVAELVSGRSKTPDCDEAGEVTAALGLQKSFINGKLHRPAMPVDHVYRDRLLTMMEKGRNRPFALVVAPAGYGKSVLVSCWLGKVDGPTAWLSLDKHDDDLHSFMVYLLAAIKTMFPDAVPKTSALLGAATLPKLPVLSAALLNELGRIEQDYILVLDDLHLIRDTSVYELLGELLLHPPNTLHLVLIGRRDPFLPIASLRAKGQVTEVRTKDLRFSIAEAAAYLRRVSDIETEDAVAAAWLEKTEGWITGLRLAALAMRHRGDIRVPSGLKGNISYVGAYLFDEVISGQSSEMRRWLTRTSILDRFCPALCDVVIGRDASSEPAAMDGWQFITCLKDQNLFLIQLDFENRWFRYHHMFQQLLRNQLTRRRSPEEITVLHLRASQWFEAQGLIDEAIQHALSADDTSRIVHLVKRNRHAMYNDGRWFEVEKWLSLIPQDVTRQSPELLLARAWVHYFHAEFAHIPPVIDAAEVLLGKAPQDQPLQGEIDLFRGVFYFMQGDGERSLAYVEAALERIRQEHQMVRGFTEMYFGMAGQMIGQLESVVPYLSRQMDDTSLVLTRRLRAMTALVWIYLIAGNLDAAESMNTKLRIVADKNKTAVFTTWSSYNQGLIHFYRNECDAARRHFDLSAETRYLVLRRAIVDSLAGVALSRQAMHQTDEAREAFEQLEEYTLPFGDPALNIIIDSCRARLSLMRGETVSASGVDDAFDQSPDVGAMLLWLEIPAVTRCRVLLAQGSDTSLEEAAEKLQAYRELARAQHNTLQTIGILAFLASVRHRQGRLDEALSVLRQAVTMAAPGGIVRPFVEAVPSMADLLRTLRQKKIAVNFIEKLLLTLADDALAVPETASIVHPVAAQDSPQPLIEPLTNRELDILELLAKRMQNKEIAQELFIAPATVKTHLRNIYQKLSAKGRRHAIERAIALGILSHR